MFSNLDGQIQRINRQPVSRTHQLLVALGAACMTAVLFGSLHVGIFYSSRWP